MLKDQGLIAQSEGSAIRIREAKSPEEITCKQDEKSGLSKTPLYTEFYRANYLKLWCPMPDNFSPEAKEPEERRNIRKFIDTLKNGLSSYGSIELDERTNTIAITDKEERVKLLVELIGLLDEPGLTVEEIVNDPDLRIK